MQQTVGMAGHQLGEIELVTLPALICRRQRDGFLPQITTGTSIHVPFVQLAALQVLANVVIEYAERLYLDAVNTRGFERHAENLAIGQNGALADKANAGAGHHQGQGLFQFLAEPGLLGRTDSRLDHQFHRLVAVVFRVDPQPAAIHFGARLEVTIQGDQPHQILGSLQRLGEIHFHMGLRIIHCPHIGDGESGDGRHPIMALAAVVQSQGLAVPAERQAAFAIAPNHLTDGEIMA